MNEHKTPERSARGLAREALSLAGKVLRDFRRNQGFLLAGAVAYNTLLSIVPLFAVLLVGLSQVIDEATLIATVRENLELVLPRDSATAIVDQVASFVEHRRVVGGVSIVALLFFSSVAFTVLENAMSVIFYHRVRERKRPFIVSALIPYVFIMALGLGLLLTSLISGALELAGRNSLRLFGHAYALAGAAAAGMYVLGVVGLALLLTALYMVMPVGRIEFRRALVGGATATVLWEIVRHVLVWYFSTLSSVNLIYGSLATSIVVLVTLEIGAIIVLLGAQVIADFDRRSGRWRTTEEPRGHRESLASRSEKRDSEERDLRA